MFQKKNPYLKKIYKVLNSHFKIKNESQLLDRLMYLFDNLRNYTGFEEKENGRYSIITVEQDNQKDYFEYLMLKQFFDLSLVVKELNK